MKKLEIELFRYREVLFGRVLHTDASLRGKGILITDWEYSIKSVDVPNIDGKVLYVNGKEESYDGFMYNQYDTEDEAIEAGVMFRELIDKLNIEEEPQIAFSQVVKVI